MGPGRLRGAQAAQVGAGRSLLGWGTNPLSAVTDGAGPFCSSAKRAPVHAGVRWWEAWGKIPSAPGQQLPGAVANCPQGQRVSSRKGRTETKALPAHRHPNPKKATGCPPAGLQHCWEALREPTGLGPGQDSPVVLPPAPFLSPTLSTRWFPDFSVAASHHPAASDPQDPLLHHGSERGHSSHQGTPSQGCVPGVPVPSPPQH